MIELTEQAGLAAPEFESTPYEVTVRFRPTRYAAPTRVSHDLSPLQRELLELLSRGGPISLRQIHFGLSESLPERTVQDNLQMLRLLGLVDLTGMRRSARWALTGTSDVSNVSNDV